MTTVTIQGQPGGLPVAERTLASVLKQGGHQTFFTAKWHLGESDYPVSLPGNRLEKSFVSQFGGDLSHVTVPSHPS